jgi:hypothetical protein
MPVQKQARKRVYESKTRGFEKQESAKQVNKNKHWYVKYPVICMQCVAAVSFNKTIRELGCYHAVATTGPSGMARRSDGGIGELTGKGKGKKEQVMGPLVGQFNGREACKDGRILSLQADID